jgi:hypothetical protein
VCGIALGHLTVDIYLLTRHTFVCAVVQVKYAWAEKTKSEVMRQVGPSYVV